MKYSEKLYTHLWNDETSMEERTRLMPHMIECQIQHLEQAKSVAIQNHERYLREMNDWIKNLQAGLIERARTSARGL